MQVLQKRLEAAATKPRSFAQAQQYPCNEALFGSPLALVQPALHAEPPRAGSVSGDAAGIRPTTLPTLAFAFAFAVALAFTFAAATARDFALACAFASALALAFAAAPARALAFVCPFAVTCP